MEECFHGDPPIRVDPGPDGDPVLVGMLLLSPALVQSAGMLAVLPGAVLLRRALCRGISTASGAAAGWTWAAYAGPGEGDDPSL